MQMNCLESRNPTEKRHIWIGRLCDLSLYVITLIGVLISFKGWIGVYPRHAYIRCDDSSISHEVLDDTIPIYVLLLVSLVIPLIMMVAIEVLNPPQKSGQSIPARRMKRAKRGFSFFKALFCGCLFSFFFVEILKTSVSEPRPHFMNSCKPNLTEEMCQKHWIHVTYDNCTNPRQLRYSRLIDTMKSFPSGHASISVFAAVFMTMYIQERIKVEHCQLLVPFLQLLCWSWAFLCCASRVWDKAHHWWDVIAGGLLGAVHAYFTVLYMCDRFENKDRQNRNQDPSERPVQNGRSGNQEMEPLNHNP